MIQALDSLVFSIYSNKGAYALLLGSGVSRAAAIPTGWEITLDLIRKLAATRNENAEPSPQEWYREAISSDLGYSSILKHLAQSKVERQQLLRPYFEPDETEKEEGLKSPTICHKAVARLVDEGYVRVILTTNFDRLVEQALAEVGITPTVVSSTSQVQGVLPLVHQTCLVVKLHGDYLDSDLKNTEEELSSYNPKLRRLLAQILSEFGLVVCGWSAEWDAALRTEFERIKDRRFTTYWCVRNELGRAAQALVAIRRAQVIPISDADSFFERLAERVISLAEYNRPALQE